MKQFFSMINLFFRSLLFTVISTVTMALYSFICVFALLLPLHYRHYLIRKYLRFYMALLNTLCQIDYKIEGLENIPKDRTGIILSKHQSAWETLYLPLIFHDPAVIIKRELFWVPFFGWGLAVSDPIAIDRNDRSSAMQQVITKGKKRLEDGRWILIFPEGTRVAPGKKGHYKMGGARLAQATGYPVIPVAHNAGRIWPKRKFIKRPGVITLVVGPLIESKGRTAEEILALTKDWIETTTARIDTPTKS